MFPFCKKVKIKIHAAPGPPLKVQKRKTSFLQSLSCQPNPTMEPQCSLVSITRSFRSKLLGTLLIYSLVVVVVPFRITLELPLSVEQDAESLRVEFGPYNDDLTRHADKIVRDHYHKLLFGSSSYYAQLCGDPPHSFSHGRTVPFNRAILSSRISLSIAARMTRPIPSCIRCNAYRSRLWSRSRRNNSAFGFLRRDRMTECSSKTLSPR